MCGITDLNSGRAYWIFSKKRPDSVTVGHWALIMRFSGECREGCAHSISTNCHMLLTIREQPSFYGSVTGDPS